MSVPNDKNDEGGGHHFMPLETVQLLSRDDSNTTDRRQQQQQQHPERMTKQKIITNFMFMSVLFSSNMGCALSCLALAVARLGHIGAWQSGTLYLTYTGSAVLGATYVAKKFGPRNAMIFGMSLYCAYVGCFILATALPGIQVPAVIIGAAIGGIGGGFLWTAQGSYFAISAEEYALVLQTPVENATSFLGGMFACCYLSMEVLLELLSTVMIEIGGFSWTTVFGVYFVIAVSAVVGMNTVRDYRADEDGDDDEEGHSAIDKVTAAWRLLVTDPKMKYMIGLNAVFGFAGAFVKSYISGEVVRIALSNDDSSYVGVLAALAAGVAAIMSIVFGSVAQITGKGCVLVVGSTCFFLVGFSFVLRPDITRWGWSSLVVVYALQGIGRSTFEGTLRATFADLFPNEKEGAFANIILQNGLSSALGYFLSYRIPWVVFELMVMMTAVISIVGYRRASHIHYEEQMVRLIYAFDDSKTYHSTDNFGKDKAEIYNSPVRQTHI